jgi:hypothetical protein
MSLYLCFIATRGSSVPELRMLEAEDEGQLPRRIAEDLAAWPSLGAIESVEILDETQRQVLVLDGDALRAH